MPINNSILHKFARTYSEPLARELGLSVVLTDADIRIQDLLPPDVANALIQFSRLIWPSNTSRPLYSRRVRPAATECLKLSNPLLRL
jgi:hypothetical protein